MDFITNFAHAGHVHEEVAAASGPATALMFGVIIGAVIIVAGTLIVMNKRKKPADDNDAEK